MKLYFIFFIILKIAILLQFALVLTNKQTIDSRIYLFTEIIFKTALFLFIEYLMFHKNIAIEDHFIVSFAGWLLLYDAWVNDMPKLYAKIKKKRFF
jgi:uncharacterized protein with PQ loop repeat